MKNFLYYFLGAIALFSIWTYVVLPLVESKPEEKEFTEPSGISEKDDLNNITAFFERWMDRGGFYIYNPLGYQTYKTIYNRQTGKPTFEYTGLVYIVEKSLYDEMGKYKNYKFLYMSDLGKDIQSQMMKCRETNTSPCRLTLNESLIQ